jgi:hypothetical protein
MKPFSLFPDKSQAQQSKALPTLESYWTLTTEQLIAALHTTHNGIQQTDAESRIKQDSVHPKSGQLAADRHFRHHRLGGRLADGFTLSRHAWVRPAAAAVLAAAGDMPPCYVILTQVVKTWFIHKFGE